MSNSRKVMAVNCYQANLWINREGKQEWAEPKGPRIAESDFMVCLKLAKEWYDAGHYDDAAAAFRYLHLLDAYDLEVCLLRAKSECGRSRPERAFEAYIDAIDLDQSDYAAYVECFHCCQDYDMIDGLEWILDKLLKYTANRPNDRDAIYYHAWAAELTRILNEDPSKLVRFGAYIAPVTVYPPPEPEVYAGFEKVVQAFMEEHRPFYNEKAFKEPFESFAAREKAFIISKLIEDNGQFHYGIQLFQHDLNPPQQ